MRGRWGGCDYDRYYFGGHHIWGFSNMAIGRFLTLECLRTGMYLFDN